jgi:hypothetical protein
MVLELILLAAIIAIVSSLVSMWALGRGLQNHKQRIIALRNRLTYVEMGMSHHDLIPLPWELEEFEKTKAFKQEGNIVYLHKEE